MQKLRYKKHLFFDLDDTLWDFQFNSERVLKELYLEHRLKEKLNSAVEDFLKEYKRVNLFFWSLYATGKIDKTHLREQRFRETFKHFGYNSDEDNQLMSDAYLLRAPRGKQLKQGCLEILNYLKEKYTLHIITNGFQEIQGLKIDGGGIRSYFTQIIVSEEQGVYKPDERIFRLAEKLSGATREDCVMIGDNLESDIQGALNAGWEAIHLDNDNTAEHQGIRIGELMDLKKLF